MKILNKMVLAVLMIVCAARSASAYVLIKIDGDVCQWDSNSKNVYFWTVSFPAGAWRDAAKNAVARFNRNPSWFRLEAKTRSVGENPAAAFILGGIDVVVTDDMDWFEDPDTPAYTSWYCDGDNMTSANIIFNANESWTPSEAASEQWDYGGAGRALRTTLLHEFGHAVGLNHENDEYNIMGTDWNHLHANGDLARAYFGEDGASALIKAYGTRLPLLRDVAVVHWRYDGTSGEYSTHRKTTVLRADGSAVPTTTIGGETYYEVAAGEVVKVEFTYENLGVATEQNIDIVYYLSTDRSIGRTDRVIGNWTIPEMGRGNVYTTKRSLTIPSDLKRGTEFWIGVMIDEADRIPEPDNHNYNNVTYAPIPFIVR